MKKLLLALIKFLKKLLYNSPIHRSKIANSVYKRLFHIVFKPGRMITTEYFGYNFTIPTDDITILPSLLNNEYERYEFSLFQQLLKPGMVVADIGANIGLVSVIAAASVGTKGKVYAFEPEPNNVSLLHRNLSQNNIRNVVVEQQAIGAKQGELYLTIERDSIGTHSLVEQSGRTVQDRIKVQVITLDSYFSKAKRMPDVIKVDVEGYEPYVFMGATKTLKAAKYLFFEFGSKELGGLDYDVKKLRKTLALFPYLYEIRESETRLIAVSIDDILDVTYANYLASKQPIEVEK